MNAGGIDHDAANLSSLLDDFVIWDRRSQDHPWLGLKVFLLKDGDLHEVCSAGARAVRPSAAGIAKRILERVIASGATRFERTQPADDFNTTVSDLRIHSLAAIPIRAGDFSLGALVMESDVKSFDPPEMDRASVLAALLGYEVHHLGARTRLPSPLSRELGTVLAAARETRHITQSELSTQIGVSRDTLSRWEEGAEPPSRSPLRRWVSALGLLSRRHSGIVTFVDATPRLVELMKSDPTMMKQLSPDQFEDLVADRIARMGYEIMRTGKARARDGGIDLLAVPRVPAGILLAVQVKHHRTSRATGRPEVDRLLAWRQTSVQLGMLVTNTRFTRDAIWAATRDSARDFVRLRDFADLKRWLEGNFGSEHEWREIPDYVELAPGVRIQVPKPDFSRARSLWPLPGDKP